MSANYKTPWSVAGGYTRHLKNGSIHVSAEFFGGISRYKIVEAQETRFIRPSDEFPDIGADTFMTVWGANKPVANVAIGFERQISELFGLITGFRTNMSYYDSDLDEVVGVTPNSSSWNIFYWTFGGRFSNARNDLMIGMQLGFGGNGSSSIFNFDATSESKIATAFESRANGSYSTVGIILGWNYLFRRKSDP